MKKKLVVLCGCPTSGKSTISKHLMESTKVDFTLISRDKVRNEIGETSYSKEGHKRVREAFHNKIKEALLSGHNVIADATHLTKHSRSELIKIAKQYDAEPHAIYIDVDFDSLVERNEQREEDKRVPYDVLHSMYLDFQPVSKVEGFKEVHKVEIIKKDKQG